MKYNELELRRLMKKDYNSLIAEEVIQINLLNFIRCIHLNKQAMLLRSILLIPVILKCRLLKRRTA
jgi:hypothetical protein